MQEFDFIIVGFGIAGITMSYQLESSGFSVAVIDAYDDKASVVAAGLFNPVILKRFTLAWGAEKQMAYALDFYKEFGNYLGIHVTEPISVYRKFHTAQEQNKWFSKSENPALSKYLSTELYPSPTPALVAPYNCGMVKGTGRVLVSQILSHYRQYLEDKFAFFNQKFDYDSLVIKDAQFLYNNIQSKGIIFCEGYRLKYNPYFQNLPLVGNKGSYIIIESPQLHLTVALKSFYFLIPLGNNLYKFGATYEHRFKSNHDVLAQKELVDKLEELISVPYKLISFIKGVRPTVIDRKPLLGEHPIYNNMYVMNGMGTRGVLLAPTVSNHLKELIVNKEPLPSEMDIKRFVAPPL